MGAGRYISGGLIGCWEVHIRGTDWVLGGTYQGELTECWQVQSVHDNQSQLTDTDTPEGNLHGGFSNERRYHSSLSGGQIQRELSEFTGRQP